ncbi:uncharacterized protein LOC111539439 [Piliocolobus tephrosceles]|uniref:uncharacterized protein LOC111539439 n=1 Tax=Piliocolobus tephrosceles TaxID=591936 RepID=UPI000C2AA8C4|nr:uncharacterized protein LOC111539439 [Piliocolobus tephrosceles]
MTPYLPGAHSIDCLSRSLPLSRHPQAAGPSLRVGSHLSPAWCTWADAGSGLVRSAASAAVAEERWLPPPARAGGTARAAQRGPFSLAAAQGSRRPPPLKLREGSRASPGTASPGGCSSRMPGPGRRAAASRRMKSSVGGRREKLLGAPKAQHSRDFTCVHDGESEAELIPDDFEEKPEREKKHTNFTLCSVCNIQLNSAAQAQIHYNGKSHQKRLKQLSNGMLKNDNGSCLEDSISYYILLNLRCHQFEDALLRHAINFKDVKMGKDQRLKMEEYIYGTYK